MEDCQQGLQHPLKAIETLPSFSAELGFKPQKWRPLFRKLRDDFNANVIENSGKTKTSSSLTAMGRMTFARVRTLCLQVSAAETDDKDSRGAIKALCSKKKRKKLKIAG